MATSNLGQYLRVARKRCKKTQAQVAKSVGVVRQRISQFEGGVGLPREDQLQDLSAAYEADLAEIRRLVQASRRDSPNEFGTKAVVNALADIAADHAQSLSGPRHDGRMIVHSVSTRGFTTAASPEVAQAVCNCAASGVDVVYMALPGNVEDASDQAPHEMCARLRSALKSAIDDYRRRGYAMPSSTIHEHLWFIGPKAPLVQGDSGAQILGSALRLLVSVHESADETSGRSPQGKPTKSDWDRAIPSSFAVDDLWLHVEEVHEHSVVPRWIQLSFADRFDARYFRALRRLRDSGEYEIMPLLDVNPKQRSDAS